MDKENDKVLPELSEFFSDPVDGARFCKLCPKKIKVKQSSTTALHRHIENLHNLFAHKQIREPKPKESKSSSSSTSSIEILSKQFPLEAKLSRMTASDGISFNLIQTSEDLREGVECSLSKIKPKVVLNKSASSIKEAVMRFGERLKDQLRTVFGNMFNTEEYFSLDFDEWVSLANCRYLNLSLLSKDDRYWNLVRITGKASADNLLTLVDQRLASFGLNRQKHIVAFVTDGCKVMERLHNHSMIEHQLCLAHAIQLAVMDVLYSKETIIVEEVDVDDNNDDNDDNVTTGFEIETSEEVSDFRSKTLKAIIAQIRKLGAHFKRSSVDADKLCDLVKSKLQLKEGKSLKLDSPTRWSSLYLMLERYYEIRECVEMVLENRKGIDATLTGDEAFLILCILKALRSVKVTVEALCNRKCNLLRARVALQVLFKQLDNQRNPFARKLLARLKERIHERWTVNSGILSYLHNGSYVDLCNNQNDSDDEDDEKDVDSSRFYEKVFEDVVDTSTATDITLNNIFSIPSKAEISTHLIQLISRLCPNDVNLKVHQPQSECSTEEPPRKRKKTFEEKLDSAVKRFEKDKALLVPQQSAISKIVSQEMAFLEKNKTRGHYLQKCYHMLLTIKPTSVESERAFSSAGMLCTKLRTRYNDNTLDTLAFLRSHLKKCKATSVSPTCKPAKSRSTTPTITSSSSTHISNPCSITVAPSSTSNACSAQTFLLN